MIAGVRWFPVEAMHARFSTSQRTALINFVSFFAPVPSLVDGALEVIDDGPDEGTLEVINGAVSDYWSITKNLFKDLWSQITG